MESRRGCGAVLRPVGRGRRRGPHVDKACGGGASVVRGFAGRRVKTDRLGWTDNDAEALLSVSPQGGCEAAWSFESSTTAGGFRRFF